MFNLRKRPFANLAKKPVTRNIILAKININKVK